MQARKVKPLDIKNGYIYHKKAQYLENFNDFLIMVFLTIVFQTSYEKCFYGKKRIHLTKLICISTRLWFWCGLTQDLCFVIHIYEAASLFQ